MGIWQWVAADFDFLLDEPGPVSGQALSRLMTFVDVEVPQVDEEWWAMRIEVAAGAPADRLLAALTHDDVDIRRVTTCVLCYTEITAPRSNDDEPTRLGLAIAHGTRHGYADGDDVTRFGTAFGALLGGRPSNLDALTLVVDEPGELLTHLPWAEPGWDTAASVVGDLIDRAPALRAPWLLAVVARDPSLAPSLADHAMQDGAPSLVEPFGIALLSDDAARHRAIRRLPRWRSDAYQDAVAALLPDPEALGVLAGLADRRCLPHLVALVEEGSPRVELGRHLSADLLPHIENRLRVAPPDQVKALLLAAGSWGDPALLDRPLAVDVLDRLDEWGRCEVCKRLSWRKRMSDEMRVRVRELATGASLRVRQYAQFALLETGDGEWLVPALITEITDHPVRSGGPGPHGGTFGWRADATACAWLGRIGPPAAAALPVLRELLTETGEPGKARAAAEAAIHLITGES